MAVGYYVETMISTIDEWRALIARIHGLRDAAAPYLASPRAGENTGIDAGAYLNHQVFEIVGALAAAIDHRPEALPPAAQACVKRAISLRWPSNPNPLQGLQAITQLSAFGSELEHHLGDHDTVWSSLVERAFLHLNRTLVVDEDVRRRWTTAFGTPRTAETKCESLGGHLLSHGIWAFKAHPPEERTDLILHEPIRTITTGDKRAVEALVQNAPRNGEGRMREPLIRPSFS